jgi:Zn-dependent M28 family amino/carboxypeptidase
MRKILFPFLLTLLFAFTALGQTTAPARDAAAIVNAQIGAIAAAVDTSQRGAAIILRLENLGLKYRFEEFEGKSRNGIIFSGKNIIAELPTAGAKKTLMICAHYDRVAKGKGAVDNASSSAAVLELLRALKAKPLKNYNIVAAFFDLEEIGLVGSAKYAEAHKDNLPTVVINFDVFGYGDTLWVMTTNDKSNSTIAVKEAVKTNNFPTIIGSKYPPSDHLSFIKAKVETLSFSLLSKDEIEQTTKLLSGEQLKSMPRVFQIIHTDSDTIDKIDGVAVVKALPTVEQAIRNLDNKN